MKVLAFLKHYAIAFCLMTISIGFTCLLFGMEIEYFWRYVAAMAFFFSMWTLGEV